MAVDATRPQDISLVSELAYWIRNTRAAHNVLETLVAAGSSLVYTDLNVAAGVTALECGVDLSNAMLEVISITGTGVAEIEEITLGQAGQVKIFRIGDGNITFAYDLLRLALNQAPADPAYGGTTGDILALMNLGGDPTVPDNGVWWELFRTPRV